MKKRKIPKKAQLVIDEIKKVGNKTDPQGMYTGRYEDEKYEKPVQDQDDL